MREAAARSAETLFVSPERNYGDFRAMPVARVRRDDQRDLSVFEYDQAFVRPNIQLAPQTLPLRPRAPPRGGDGRRSLEGPEVPAAS